jgi:NAD(P)-dependent dehydrogenase (short-subunit alcohol dehydrogenase family)
MRLPNTVALVTGGGSGIGRAIGLRFAREGAQVILADRYGDRAQSVAKDITAAGGEAIGLEADVADETAVGAMAERAIAAFGRIDVLVNNAGLSKGDDVLEIDSETWDLNLDVVLKGVFLCSKAVLPPPRPAWST